MAGEKKLDPKALVKTSLIRALDAQYPLAVSNVARLRRVHPDKSPEELISFLNKVYVGTVATTGAERAHRPSSPTDGCRFRLQ